MRTFALTILLALIVAACHKKPAAEVAGKETCKSGKKFDMYKMSEMSVLMEQMYADNERLKQRILKGDTIGKFPSHFLEIHRAAMTDQKENDNFFRTQASAFITAQRLIYEDPANAQAHFNDGVSACVKCHEVKCAGPIKRIKKLYIPT